MTSNDRTISCCLLGALLTALAAAGMAAEAAAMSAQKTKTDLNAAANTFGDDIAFLRKHTDVIVLRDDQGAAQVALAPAWQGRVMTSTAEHDRGRSFGWINRELIASRKLSPHFNAFGGEDRLWLGPEGGQFSIYFAKDAPFDLEHWFVPAPLDTRPFRTVSTSRNHASFESEFSLTNYSGTHFQVAVRRDVDLLEPKAAWAALGLAPSPNIALVAYQSRNTLVNAGNNPWKRETGLLSLWVLGMFSPSPSSAIVVPIKSGSESELGPLVTSDYFGDIPPERLRVTETAILLRADGEFRSKIGINPRRSLGKLGSYDADGHVLTIVLFSQPEGITDYVNSLWKLQDNPYAGDAANSYNDGPSAPGGKPFGPFFEMESSSPAAALAPGASIEHIHRTLHLIGPDAELDKVARSILGVELTQIGFPGADERALAVPGT